MLSTIQMCFGANNILLIETSSCVKMADSFRELSESFKYENKLGDRMIRQLSNWLSQNIVIFQCFADQLFASAFGFSRKIIYMLAADKSRYFAKLNLIQ